MRSLIVALLCMTLFVDSAKACWWLRQHRSRSQVCRPIARRPASSVPCTDMLAESPAHDVVVVSEHAACCCDGPITEPANAERGIEHDAVERGSGEHQAVIATDQAKESVVVHGPTMVVDPATAQAAASVPAPAAAVVPQPSGDKPAAAVAQPMPVATAGPAVLSTPAAAEEPIPTLKPAIATQSPVAPASNEQPMAEPSAKPAPLAAAASAKPTATDDADDADDADEPAAPMPAPVNDLAGGPPMKPPMPEPKEPNLFDLYGDEDDDAPAEDASDDAPSKSDDDDAGEPAEDSATETDPSDEAEMTDDEPDGTESEATDSEDADGETADEASGEKASEDAGDGDSPEAEEADAAPASEPEQDAADPAAAAVVVPNEPMRRWSDATGSHHTQGWLVALRNDRVRILKVNGRHATVSMDSLSAADRDYVSMVGARLAAEGKGTSPAASTTAGL